MCVSRLRYVLCDMCPRWLSSVLDSRVVVVNQIKCSVPWTMSIVVPSDGLLIGVLDVLMMVDEDGSPMG